MADSADPAGIIAFTFTERAVDELKARISARVEERLECRLARQEQNGAK